MAAAIPNQVVTFVAAYMLLAITLGILVRAALTTSWRVLARRLRKAALGRGTSTEGGDPCIGFRSPRAWWREWRDSVGQKDPAQAKVRARLQAWQLSQYRCFSGVLVLLHLPLVVDIILSMIDGEVVLQDALALVHCQLLLVPHCLPKLFTVATLEFWFAAAMVCTSLQFMPLGSEGFDAARHAELARLAAGLLSAARMHWTSASIWNAVRLAPACWFLAQHECPSDSCPGLGRRIAEECFCALLFSILAGTIEARAATEICKGMEDRRAIDGLLTIICDVVTELDEELLLRHSARELAGFLLRGANVSLQGTSFLDLIIEADRASFLECMRQVSFRQMRPEVMRLRMRDGIGNSINVEVFVFHTRHTDSTSERHLIGIREASRHMQPEQRSDDAFEFKEEDQEQVSRIASGGEVAVMVDSAASEMPILAFTPGFNALVGPLTTGLSLLKLVSSRDAFRGWVQMMVNMHCNGEEDPGEMERSNNFSIRLRPRGSQNTGGTRAICKFNFGNGNASEDTNASTMSVWLHFQLVQCDPAMARTRSHEPVDPPSPYTNCDGADEVSAGASSSSSSSRSQQVRGRTCPREEAAVPPARQQPRPRPTGTKHCIDSQHSGSLAAPSMIGNRFSL
mmetsp:Transcript_102087/g.284209  ORF Transcript_102087/g.284209 Transcript_102087/m.284209 type:complete len:627 (-) Transcript_102087:91-1971(-)